MAATKKNTASNPEKKSKKPIYSFDSSIENEEGKEEKVSYFFLRDRFKVNKKVIEVASLFDAKGKAKEESVDILSHLVLIRSGVIKKK